MENVYTGTSTEGVTLGHAPALLKRNSERLHLSPAHRSETETPDPCHRIFFKLDKRSTDALSSVVHVKLAPFKRAETDSFKVLENCSGFFTWIYV